MNPTDFQPHQIFVGDPDITIPINVENEMLGEEEYSPLIYKPIEQPSAKVNKEEEQLYRLPKLIPFILERSASDDSKFKKDIDEVASFINDKINKNLLMYDTTEAKNFLFNLPQSIFSKTKKAPAIYESPFKGNVENLAVGHISNSQMREIFNTGQ